MQPRRIVNALAPLHGAVCFHQDRLVSRFAKKGRAPFSRGKRVGKDCPLTREEIRAYVNGGSIKAVIKIRELRGCGLREALDLLNAARGEAIVPQYRGTQHG